LQGSGKLLDEVLPIEQLTHADCEEHYATLRNSWGQMFAEGLDPIEKGAVALR